MEWLVEFSFLHGAKGRPGTLLSFFPQSLEHVLRISYSHEKSSDWHEALAKYKKTIEKYKNQLDWAAQNLGAKGIISTDSVDSF